jgi:HSP20 family protein
MKKNSISLFTDLFDDSFSLFQVKNDLVNLKTNIKETKNDYEFYINVAGIKKENIDIKVNEGYLVVSVKEETVKEDVNEENYIRKEMVYKDAKRKYYIGNIKEEKINATLENGILKIVVPKDNQEYEKKSIEIK